MANFTQIWKKVLNIGRTDSLHYLDIQRNSILNAIAFTTIFIALVVTVLYAVLGFSVQFIPLIALPICFSILWLNHKAKYGVARGIAFFGFLIVISIWSFYTRRTGAELLYISLAAGSASVLRRRGYIFTAMIICSITYIIYALYDKMTPFVPDPTINYFIINTILTYTTAGTVFFLSIVYVDITAHISKKLDANYEELNIAFENQKVIEKKLIHSNNELLEFNKKLDSLVKESNEELYSYQAAINDNLHSIVTDEKGVIIKINNLYLKKTGYEREELLGQSIDVLKSDDHDQTFYQSINEMISSGKVWRGESRIKTKSDVIFWITSSIIPILDMEGKIAKYLTISSDITDRKLAEEKEKQALKKLIKSEKRLSLFLENLTDLVVITNKEGDRKYVNKAFCEFFGNTSDYYIGTNYKTLYPHEVDPVYVDLFDSISYDNPFISSLIVRENAKGEKKWMQWNEIAFFDSNNNVLEILSIGHDISDLKENEFQNANYIAQFEEIAFKNSHRFRRPLSNIIGIVDLIDDDSTAIEIKELIAIIKNEILDLDVASHELSDFINTNSKNMTEGVTSINIDFTEAKLKHLKWKYKVRNFLDGSGSLTKSQAISHQECDTGKWLYSLGKEKYGHIEAIKKFEKEHEKLHHLIKEIVGLKTDGKTQNAEAQYLELVKSLDKIIVLLDESENSINNQSIVSK
jgi:PAS domain S-box-containing protein